MSGREVNSNCEFLDPKYWHYEDKQWLASRKTEWREVQHVNKIWGGMLIDGRGVLAAHKAFFFKGEYEIDKLGLISGDGRMGGLNLFRYHPELANSVCESIVKFYDHPRRAGNMAGTLKKLFDCGGHKRYSPEYGFMGGREARVIEYFCSERAIDIMEKYDVNYGYSLSPRRLIRFLASGLNYVLNGMPNPWHPGQYLWKVAKRMLPSADDPSVLELLQSRACKNFITALEKIAYFDSHPKTAKNDPHAIALRNELLNELTGSQEDLPDIILILWGQVKGKNGS